LNLILTEEQHPFRQTVRTFVDRVIVPTAAENDRTGTFPWANLRGLAELGVLGLLVPPEHGGAGAGTLEAALAIEEIARGCASTAVVVSVHNALVCDPIARFGTPDQQARYLGPLARGELIGAFALTEPNAGSDAAALATTARREGDHYVLDGTKVFITSGDVAGVILLFATVDRARGAHGITAFLVDRDAPGLRVGRTEDKLGLRAASTVELILEGCRVPAANRLGGEGEGYRLALQALASGRIGIAAQAVGIARAALEAACAYARERRQFGRPIAEFQGLQWMLAEMALAVDAARLLTWRAARLRDAGLPHAAEASMAKIAASETAVAVASKAIQVFGGYGYTKDFPVERYFRDAKATEIYEGTNQIHRTIIARHLLGGPDR
jgi:butyryl-CoA dehydrogenase